MCTRTCIICCGILEQVVIAGGVYRVVWRWDGIIECLLCGFHILVPDDVENELDCPNCQQTYVKSDDMGWFDYQIYRFTPKGPQL